MPIKLSISLQNQLYSRQPKLPSQRRGNTLNYQKTAYLIAMVHAFKYCFKGKDYHFLWDVESGSLHNVDQAAYNVAAKRYCGADIAHSGLSAGQIAEIEDELKALEANGTLNTEQASQVMSKPYGNIKALCLHICHDCNLRCKYCFANEGTYNTERDYMSYDVGKSAVDYLIAHSGNRQNLEIDFFGGEPLMNMDVVKRIVAYARSCEADSGKKFSFTITTNCLLINDELIEYINAEMYNVVLSIDGRRNVHNNVRKSVNGKECYDVILSNALKLAKARGDKSYYVRGTFTSANLDFANDIKFLRDAGFEQISVEPVVLDEGSELAITQAHLPSVLQEYDRLAEIYIDSRRDGKWFNFFHFMIDLENGPCINKRLSGCGSGCEYLAVTPIGDIYPCHQFAGDNEYIMGNVLSGEADRNVMAMFSKNIVGRKEKCAKCPAKYYCSGGCCANNFRYGNGMNEPYGVSCEMMVKRFELSLAIAAIEGSYS